MKMIEQIRLLFKIVKTSHSFNPKITFYEILHGLSSGIYVVIKVIMPAQIVNLIVKQTEWEIVLAMVIFYGIAISLLGLGKKVFKLLQEAHGFKNCNLFRLSMNQKFMKVDYADTENADVIDKFEQAKESMWEFTDVGYVFFNDILGNLIIFICMSFILLDMNVFVYMVVLCAVVFITYFQFIKSQCIHDSELKEKVLNKNIMYTSSVMQDISSGKEIRVFDLQNYLSDKLKTQIDMLEGQVHNKEQQVFKVNLKITIIRFIQLLCIYIVAIKRYMLGLLEIGSFILYISAVEQLADCVKNLFDAGIELSRVAMYYKDYENYMSLPETLHETGSHSLEMSSINIKFDKVCYKYPGCEKNTLQDLNLEISAHDKVAIVGENGSGKTTFIKLLLRLYDPTEGSIYLNGRNIKEYKYDEYLNVFSSVFQDFAMFAYSILENISFDQQLDKERLDILLTTLGLRDKFKKYARGTDSFVTKTLSDEGINLSGGELQLVAMARALYKSSDILIFDEPTSALDPIKEAEIYQLINETSENKIKIYCSHRMSSTKFCNKILVFDSGRLAEKGNHEFLMEQEGIYYNMFQKQALLYR